MINNTSYSPIATALSRSRIVAGGVYGACKAIDFQRLEFLRSCLFMAPKVPSRSVIEPVSA